MWMRHLPPWATGLALAMSTGSAEASFTFLHNGSTNPASEGCDGNAGPLANDEGYPAWSTSGGVTYTCQYYPGALTSGQQADISSLGFVLTVRARALPGTSPVYAPFPEPGVFVWTGSQLFAITLALDGNGNTIVILPTSQLQPSYHYWEEQGPTTTIADTNYHVYQLVYNSTDQSANLFIDGVSTILSYGGFPPSSDGCGGCSIVFNMIWGGINGGQSDFNDVEWTTTPVPVPGVPTNVIAIAGNGQATVSFTPPSYDTRDIVGSYTVTANPGNITATGSASPITVAGLTNGTAYTFSVTACNAGGCGQPSASVTFSTPVPAFPPFVPWILAACLGCVGAAATRGRKGHRTS